MKPRWAGGRDGCGRLSARARGGGWGSGKGSPCHHVGWLYCLVPPLDPPAPWELLPWCRQRQCTASLPAARPALWTGARTRSPQPAGRFSRVAPPRRTRPWRKTVAPAADGTARMAGTRPARPRSPRGRSTIYPGTATAARPHAPGKRAPTAPGRVPCSCPTCSPPASRGRGRGLDPRRTARICRRPGLRRKRACRGERGNARAGAH